LQYRRKQYVAKGGRLVRELDSIKTIKQKQEEYKETINLLKKDYSIRDMVKLARKGMSIIH